MLSLVLIRISEGPLEPGSLVSLPGQTTLKWIPKQIRAQAPAPCSEQYAQWLPRNDFDPELIEFMGEQASSGSQNGFRAWMSTESARNPLRNKPKSSGPSVSMVLVLWSSVQRKTRLVIINRNKHGVLLIY